MDKRFTLRSFLLLFLISSAFGQFFRGGPCKSNGCGPGEFIPLPPDQLLFGKTCKSKGCGILRGPFGDVIFGGGCKSKGCPVPSGFPIPGVSPSPVPRRTRRPRRPRRPQPICCTPDGCLRGYRPQCMSGSLSPSLAALGYFSASGSCSGALSKFSCARAEVICSGNRGRCVYKRCGGGRGPRPSRRPGARPSRRPAHPSPWPKSKARYGARFLNVTEGFVLGALQTERQVAGFCKSKRCPFGTPDQVVFGGQCKSKGCAVVNTPGGPLLFGGGCKSKGCPLPPGFVVPGGSPSPRPRRPRRSRGPRPAPSPLPPLPPRVRPFQPPRRGQCCFARPCKTQRICRCILSRL